MLNRRDFMRAGAAGTIACALGGPTWIAASLQSARLPLHAAVIDPRFSESMSFGHQMQRLGVPIRSIQGDVTDLWYHELDAIWKARLAPLAGLTDHATLFCLERLAWDRGMRVLYRGEHRTESLDSLVHVLSGPARSRVGSPVHWGEPERWPAKIASRIALWQVHSEGVTAQTVTPGGEGRVVVPCAGGVLRCRQPLHSWVIAPRAYA